MNNHGDDYWKSKLTPAQYAVLRQKATEPPFSGQFDNFWQSGVYRCAGCNSVLFSSDTKYDAGCGWPSFWGAVDDSKIKLARDHRFGFDEVEVQCGVCGGHLGHLFNDGPLQHGGTRYCINSAALDFTKKAE